MSHANICIFVPHVGCPHRCSFCDQNSITGQTFLPHKGDVDSAVKVCSESKGYIKGSTELAFFGGSFTAINRDYMNELLDAAYKYVADGTICGIRISTRPDYIDRDVLELLKSRGVTAVELGAQSMRDEVLEKNNRGHSAVDVVNASALIKEYGISLGLQMMTGLYGSSRELDRLTSEEIIRLKPDTVRIYPTVTLKGTSLERLYLDGSYIPPTLSETVELCAELISLFDEAGIKVIRTGLHSIDMKAYVAGPWHPAFRELCDGRIYLNKAIKALQDEPHGEYMLFVAPTEISKMTGQKKCNINALETAGYICRVKPLEGLKSGEVVPERMNNSCI